MTEGIRTQILDAAETRFRTYGFGKTTMAEIATDVDMSTANLYRFYENKLDIGSAMAKRSFIEREAYLTSVLQQEGLNAAQRFEAFVVETLRYMHGQFSREPKISELVDVIVKKRPDLVQEQIASDQRMIKIVLEKGKESGDFVLTEINEVSGYVLAAIVKFTSPFFMAMYSLEELESVARGVVSLILNGLLKR
jgi:AcrR family transcriptional regulator